jgi:hypothetical protein
MGEDIAISFALRAEDTKVIMHVMSNKGLPVTSISAYPVEAEHLMRPGEKYRILNVVDTLKNQGTMDKSTRFHVYAEHLNMDEIVDYELNL